MSIVSKKSYDDVDPDVRELWDQQVSEHGRMTNMKRTLAHSVDAFRSYMEFYPLKKAVSDAIGERATVLFVHAVSEGTDCLICSTYFRRTLSDWGEEPNRLTLSDEEQLLVDYGLALIRDSNRVPDKILDDLQSRFPEQVILNITALGGLMIATNILNNALKIDLDEYLYKFRK